jgi:Macrocin-O-methyltransferase (TylF)
MIGKLRMDNLRATVEYVIKRNIPGDLIETGAWRGGACIFMRSILKAYAIPDRIVWVADSFQGLPRPNPEKYPADARDRHHTFTQLAVSLEEVRGNFLKYGLLDEQVKFLVGWFKDTLPTVPIERLAILRLDGDIYESTMEALVCLYGKVSLGGVIIVDDYGAIPACRKAIHDFREANRILDPIQPIDGLGVYWIKSS